jgi:alpha-mannosidase
LIRGTLYPDPLADLGEQHFSYALLPHVGDWTTAGVTRQAFWFNSAMSSVPVPSNPSDAPSDVSLPPSGGFVRCSGLELGLGSLKQPEDEDGEGVILRLYEPHGARGLAALTFPREVKRAERVTLLEEHDASVLAEATEPIVSGDTIRISVRPFEVLTLRVVL